MILLDTDHLTVLMYRESARYRRLSEKLQAVADRMLGTTIINIEEQMRGWLASIARERKINRQIPAYRELAGMFQFFGGFHIALFNDSAVQQFESLRSAKLRIGTMDLKIASIVLANDALLLSANAKDFSRIPGLRFESWVDDSH